MVLFEFASLFSLPYFIVYICGIATVLFIQCALIYLYFISSNVQQSLSHVPSIDAYTFPAQLLELITEKFGENTEGTVLLNLLLQFWFHENRYNPNILTAIGRRLDHELTEFLTNTSVGSLFSSLKVRDIELGNQSISIGSVRLKTMNMDQSRNVLNNFVFEFDINYTGGFYMSVDAVVKLNNSNGFVSIKVCKCVGTVRVEFTRLPYTHWSMSFVTAPDIDFNIESKLQGHTVPHLNKILGIQLRRRISKKFVMPFYKIRTKPFLPTYQTNVFADNPNIPGKNGALTVTIMTVSRIPTFIGQVFCTLTVDTAPWIQGNLSTNYNTVLHHIKKPSRVGSFLPDNRKLSTGSALFDKQQEGLRQRVRSMTGQEDITSSTIDEFRRKSFTDSLFIHNKSASEDNSIDENISVYHTTHFPFCERVIINERFEFSLTPPIRYLNIFVWKEEDDAKSITLAGYVSIPVVPVVLEPGIGKTHRLFYLTPAARTKKTDPEYQKLSSHPGFNPSICFGDVTVAFSFEASPTSSVSTPIDQPSSTEVLEEHVPVETASQLSELDNELSITMHAFNKISVLRPLTCEFCLKTIWVKDAFRCEKCNYLCHKKCLTNCESAECRSTDPPVVAEDALEMASRTQNVSTPEIITTSAESNASSTKSKLSNFFGNVRSVRRVGSASSLAPPSSTTDETTASNITYSLPQSTGHSPMISRKASMCCDVTLFESTPVEDEVEKALYQLLSMPQSEQMLQSVKNSGRKLCIDLKAPDREIRINEMIAKIKEAIDKDTEICADLQEREKLTADDAERVKLALQLRQSEERLQALTNLLLHCCSGLQDSQDNTPTTVPSI